MTNHRSHRICTTVMVVSAITLIGSFLALLTMDYTGLKLYPVIPIVISGVVLYISSAVRDRIEQAMMVGERFRLFRRNRHTPGDDGGNEN